jgi:hypothetical protein
MSRLYIPGSIVEETNTRRVFYFHEFAYFVHTLDYTDERTHDFLKSYFVCLLLVFDEILVPLEHVTISCSPEEADFKARFLNSAFVRELISQGRLVTTRWSACSDTPQHIEACDRYMHSIHAGSFHFANTAETAVLEMPAFKRDQASQSLGTRDFAEAALGDRDRDLLKYEDGPVVIQFSVENAILGKAQGKLAHPRAREVAESAYVRAMTIGNGKIYRAAVDRVESFRYSDDTFFMSLVSLTESQGIDPVLLRWKFLFGLLLHVGYQVPMFGPATWVWEQKKWTQDFLSYVKWPDVARMKDTLIELLKYMSLYGIKSYEEFQGVLQTIVVKPFELVLARWIVLTLTWRDRAIEKLQELAEGRQPMHNLCLDTYTRNVFNHLVKEGTLG